MENIFTVNIKSILEKHFGKNANEIYEKSQLIQYINEKTRSANRGSKSRSSFANLYAIYVIIEDYVANGFNKKGDYSKHEGALFNKLFARQRELPFGSKLQNHALNNRMNSEFQKYFPSVEFIPILRNLSTNRYWFNENLLKIKVGKTIFNIAKAIIEIIDEYSKTKQDAFQRFIKSCEELQKIGRKSPKKVEEFISGLLAPNVDARLFEIVSYSILKYYYHDQIIYWGYDINKLNKENLKLYKTGRTNANDGGIDFVMKPLGRFFQVTETLDFKKYFLDIDKIQKFPITFVIKSDVDSEVLLKKIRENASKSYSIKAIVGKYMDCIEEVINIPMLNKRFKETVKLGYLNNILNEVVAQSKVEFNYADEEDENAEE
ncbi:MAG: restriction endonuclease [Bacteroidetes bacterium]|nr:restriction endonuclease [Bacteroidota bacterium]